MNTQPRHPKCRALPVERHPDIHFSAMIPRRTVKIKFFLSVVISVVKAAFVPFSAIGENPANAGIARLCGVSPHPIPDTATALPKQARYHLRYTRSCAFAVILYQTQPLHARFFGLMFFRRYDMMEKLIEAYKTVNPNAELELQTTDSTTGVSGALEGT